MCCFQPLKYTRQDFPAGHLLEFLLVKRIQTHINPAESSIVECLRLVNEPDAVRCQTDVLKSFQLRQSPYEYWHAGPDKRLAARNPHFVHTQSDENAGKLQNLVIRHERSIWHEGHVFRHTVDAPKVADICNRDPKIRMDPPQSGQASVVSSLTNSYFS